MHICPALPRGMFMVSSLMRIRWPPPGSGAPTDTPLKLIPSSAASGAPAPSSGAPANLLVSLSAFLSASIALVLAFSSFTPLSMVRNRCASLKAGSHEYHRLIVK